MRAVISLTYDTRFSLREDTDITYDSLVAKPDMKIVNVDKYHVGGGRVEKGQYIVHNTDFNRAIIVGKNALLHGLNLHYENNAYVTVHMDEYSKML